MKVQDNIMNRRALLATMAVAVPAVIAGAPMTAALADQPARAEVDPKAAIDLFAIALLSVPVCAIAEDDDNVVYAVRVPRESLGSDPYPVDLADDTVGAEIAALVAARIRKT